MSTYNRLVRTADPFDFLMQPNTDFEDKPEKLDRMEADQLLDPNSSEETVQLNEVDSMEVNSILQNIFFDLYGTNIPSVREPEIFNALPLTIPNSIDDFQLLVIQTFRKLKVYEWVDTNENSDKKTPQQLSEDVDELVDSGNVPEVNNDQIDTDLQHDFGSDEEDGEDGYDEAINRQSMSNDVNKLIRQAEYFRDRDEVTGGYSSSGVRSLSAVAESSRNRVYDGEEGITQAYANIVRNPNVSAWDVGIGGPATGRVKTAQDAFMSAGGGSGSGGSWFTGIESGAYNVSDNGFPVINCDNLAG